MRLSKAWLVARKDLAIFRRKRNLLYSVVAFPLAVAVGLPLVLRSVLDRSGPMPPGVLEGLLDAFAFFFVIGAATLPTAIASYTLVGEKVEKSLEPLLATPTTDGEILLGKALGAIVPPLIGLWIGCGVFMTLADLVTRPALGFWYFPNPAAAIVFGLLAPLAGLLSVEASVLISSKVSDVRSAQQIASLIVLPFAAIYVAAEVRAFLLTTPDLLALGGALAAVDLGLLALTRAAFRRDQILTSWR